MTSAELDAMLGELNLSQIEAARLLSVDARTFRRWVEDPGTVPGPAEQALTAWLSLHRFGLPWGPDTIAIRQSNSKAVAAYRTEAIDLAALLNKVKKRGGPAAPWTIDLSKCQATLGPLQVSFYRQKNGGFSPQFYRRKDGPPDLQRDWSILEDAFALIAQEIAQERRK